MLTCRDENFLAGNFVAAVTLRDRFRFQQTEIGTAMRLREVHGAAPLTGDHVRQIHLLLFVRAVVIDRVSRAARQAGIHAERHICRRDHFGNRDRETIGQPRLAIFRIKGEALPATLFVDLVCFFKALWRRHRSVGMTGAAFLVARMVDRVQDIGGHFRAFFENCRDHILRSI